MRLILDIQACQSSAHADRGIARYVQEHAAALLESYPDRIATLVLNPTLPPPVSLIPALEFHADIEWNTWDVFNRVMGEGPTAYMLMSPIELQPSALSIVPPHVARAGLPLISTLYDLIPLNEPERYLADARLREQYHRRLALYRHSDVVLAISEDARRDSIELLGVDPSAVVSIGGGVSDEYRDLGAQADALRKIADGVPEVVRPYVLSTLGCDDRKNAEGLIRAFARLPAELRDRLQLVIACGLDPNFERKWREEAAVAGLGEDDVVLTGFVPDDVLRALYAKAEVFVFPSFREGFGLPPAEAMASGVPTIVSNRSSLPEVVDLAEATFDPADDAAIAAAIERAIDDPEHRARLLANGARMDAVHTWPNVAARSMDAIDRRLRRHHHKVTSQRPTVALVGPMPPTASGIADYNARVARELSRICDLDIVVADATARGAMPDISGARIMTPNQFAAHANPFSYDAVIYTLGNSEHHHETVDLLHRYPGWVWMHDVRLVGLYVTMAAERASDSQDGFLGTMLDEIYGHRNRLHGAMHLDAHRLGTSGMYMSAGVIRSSRGVLTNSAVAARMLRRECGPDSVKAIKVLPFGMPSDEFPPCPADPDVGFVTLGIVSHVKLPLTLVDALAELGDPSARLTFVGHADKVEAKHIVDRARERGVEGSVRITGRVSQQEYVRLVAAATGGIQLRGATHGESSAAVADLLAAGTPAFTNVVAFHGAVHPGLSLHHGRPAPGDVASWMRSTAHPPHARDADPSITNRIVPFATVARCLVDAVLESPSP